MVHNTSSSIKTEAAETAMTTMTSPVKPVVVAAPTTSAVAITKEATAGEGREQAPDSTTTKTVKSAKRKQTKTATPTKAEEDSANEPEETRRPPKKRKKSLQMVQSREPSSAEPEDREQASTTATNSSSDSSGGERQDASPITAKPVKGRGDTAWETLMNVAALVPPLPTQAAATETPTHSRVVSVTGTPSPSKSVKASPGSSYSSKHRAINNDVVPNEQRWYDMFGRLEKFKALKGHCRVPNRYSGDASLGSWVATQRRYFKNKALPMPADRVKLLTDLGFEWTTKDPRKVPWETRFEDLQSFKDKFGHADVPHEWEECPQLGFWTANMRQQYRYKQLGKKSSLTDARITLLNSIGFVWKMQGGRRKKSDPVARPNQGTPGSSDHYEGQHLPPSFAYSNHHPSMRSTAKQLVLDPMSRSGGMTSAHVMLGHAATGVGPYSPPPSLPPMMKMHTVQAHHSATR